jgi:hypothetical protein
MSTNLTDAEIFPSVCNLLSSLIASPLSGIRRFAILYTYSILDLLFAFWVVAFVVLRKDRRRVQFPSWGLVSSTAGILLRTR